MASEYSLRRRSVQFNPSFPGDDAMKAQETAEERWRPILGVEAILISVISMMNDPNTESPANLNESM